MTARVGPWRRLHPAVRVVIVLVVLVILVNIAVSVLDSSTRGADETAPRSSSLSTGRDGLAGYAELLRRNDHDTQALRGSITDTTLFTSDTLVVLDPVGLDDEDARDIRRFVERGGRLVAGGSSTTRLLAELFPDPPTSSSVGVRIADPVGAAREVADLRTVRSAGYMFVPPDD